jgi:diaminohydroxyphosphoribosylaminopyrimidine deaminase/5-amino-6-(5-phosphoribosylamino)uracil reductase
VTLPGATVIQIPDEKNTVEEVLKTLHEMKIQSLLVEGGAFIIRSFIEAGMWDEARRFTGSEKFGSGVPDPFPSFIPGKTFIFEKSILEIMHHFHLKSV